MCYLKKPENQTVVTVFASMVVLDVFPHPDLYY